MKLPPFEGALERDPIELFLLRTAFAAVAWYGTWKYHFFYTEQPIPVGFAQYVDLTFLSDPAVFRVLNGIFIAALALFAAGRALPLALGYMLLFTVGIFTLKNSQGALSHGTHVVPLAILGMLIGHLDHALRRRTGAPSKRSAQELGIYHASQLVVAMYVLAGVTKLIEDGLGWIVDLPEMATSIVKARDSAFYSTLKPDGALDESLEIGNYILQHGAQARVFLGAGLFVELLAFLALWNRRAAFAVGFALVVLHLNIRALMHIDFRLNMLVVGVLFLGVPYALARALRKIRPARAGAAA